MKSAILSGKDSLKLWNPSIQFLHRLPRKFQTTTRNCPPRVSGLRSFVGLSEWRVTFFWNAGQRKASGRATEAFRRDFVIQKAVVVDIETSHTYVHPNVICEGLLEGCHYRIPKVDSVNMSRSQLRDRKETTAEITLQFHTVQNGIRSTSESSPGEVEKLTKENFEVDSWQFKLLERHEANNLNSYTVAELRQLLREMKKQPKGQKSDLLKAVKSWLYDQTPPAPGGEEKPAKLLKESSLKTAQKRRKDDHIVVENGVEELRVKKARASQKVTKESAVGHEEPWTVLVHKRPQVEWVAYNPKTMRPPKPMDGARKEWKLVSWNVNGLRALLKEKGGVPEEELKRSRIAQLAAREDFDVLCLQETKLQEKDVENIRKSLLSSHEESLWSCSISKLGYSGTAIISRRKPLSVHYGLGLPVHDKEGRLITCEFDCFYFVVCYVPNSGAKLERLAYRTKEWDVALSSYLKELEKKKPVILTGDLNCAHEEIDIHDPAGNKRSAGFTDEERESFRTNFLNNGFVDTFRKQHPHAVAYTYWGYRTAVRPKNRGWRLEYFLVSESLSKDVHDSYTIPDVGGSDHCPIGLVIRT